MYYDYPLDNDSTLETNLTKHLIDFNIVLINFKGPKWILELQKASINTLVVSHNDNISFSYFANVKHTWNSMQTVALN